MAALLVSVLEARAVSAKIVEGGTPPGLMSLVLADVGALLPVVVAAAAAAWVAFLVLASGDSPTVSDRLARWRGAAAEARFRRATGAPLFVFAVFAWLVGTAHAARSVLAAGTPVEAGLTLGLTSVALLLGMCGVALSLVPGMRRILAIEGVRPWADPLMTGGAALALVVGLFALGIVVGDTGGEGGLLAVFGVLKREELDLRPVIHLGVVGAGACFAQITRGLTDPSGRVRVAPGIVSASGLFGLLLSGGMCLYSARGLADQPLVARGIEEHAPLGKISLGLLRKASDRDHDGFSTAFGGGDCNDRDATVNPSALDIPGNGVDDDCSGADTPAPSESLPVPSPASRVAARPRRSYNVVLFTVDTLRPDLGFMGYGKPTSPNLDKLAEKGTVFERAYSMASYTGKSVGPMMIGRYPSETLRDGGHFNTYFPKNVFVAERVHDGANVRTFAAHCHFYFRSPTGLNQGMDVWDTSALPPGMGDNDTSVTSARMSDVALKMLAQPENTALGARQPNADAGSVPQPTAVGTVEGEPGEPRRFFAWFHFFDPHAQYVPHEGAPDFSGGSPAKALYDQEVWFTDKHIGKVLDYIAQQPWAEDTAIVVTADHGEAFADHGMSWHGMEIWESLVRVPLLVYVPGAKPRRVPLKRSHIDVAPTLLELLGGPPAAEGELRGKSLLEDVYLAEGVAHEERDVFIDMPLGPYTPLRRAIITGPTPGMKLINSGGARYQLFDLEADPKEAHDLASDKERLTPIVERMQSFRARLSEVDVRPNAR